MNLLPPLEAQSQLETTVREQVAALGLAVDAAETALNEADYFAVLEQMVPRRSQLSAAGVAKLAQALENLLRLKTLSHPQVGLTDASWRGLVPVVFGTSGHRGEIGKGLTLLHVHAIVQAMIEQIDAMPADQLQQHFAASDLKQVKARGFLLGHDNRLCNPEFSFYTAHLLMEAGYRVAYGGVLASPEVALVVPRLGFAGGINFTPSHNPFRYGGIKFSPTDGGLAGNDLSEPLAQAANRILQSTPASQWPTPEALHQLLSESAANVERLDVHGPYLEALAEHPVVRLKELAKELADLPAKERLLFVVDPVWGGAVPVYQRLQELLGSDVLQLIHTETDPYFGGQVTEPNEDTLGETVELLSDAKAKYRVGIRNDPDGDRGLVADHKGAIKTNKFAALAMRYLTETGHPGEVVTTVPTSHFGVDWAKAHNLPVHLTAVGFKYFRELLQSGRAMIAYEESDGLSIAGHTLDKDGVLAGLLAVRMVLHYRTSLADLLEEAEAELGRYHWVQDTFPIGVSAKEAQQALTAFHSLSPGQEVEGAGFKRILGEVDFTDGIKLVFDDGDWILIRPSGTEPLVRIYAESKQTAETTSQLTALGRDMALKVMSPS